MRASAALATEQVTLPDGSQRSRASRLRSQAPLMLRLTNPREPEPWTANSPQALRVCLAAGAAGPVGGDELNLTVDVGPGSTLVLGEISATLLLPGPRGEQSCTRTTVTVGPDATLVWLPEPVIAARDCHHRNEVRVELAAGARLILREQLLLGRHGEHPGTVHQQLRVRLDGRPLFHQNLAVGPDAPGWNSPAVAGGRRAIGSLLVVDPTWLADPPPPTQLGSDGALMRLEGPAAVVSVLTSDGLFLRRRLDQGLDTLTSWRSSA